MGANLDCERPTTKIFGDVVLLSSASIAARPMPDVAPTKTAVSDCFERELLAARTALIVTILQMGRQFLV